MMPSKIYSAVNNFVLNIYVNRLRVWDSLLDAFAKNVAALEHTPVVLAYREDDTVKSRKLVYSIPGPGYALWGLPATNTCWNCDQKGCVRHYTKPGQALEMRRNFTECQAFAKFKCLRCGVSTSNIQRPPWIHPIQYATNTYWYEWPEEDALVEELQARLRALQVGSQATGINEQRAPASKRRACTIDPCWS